MLCKQKLPEDLAVHRQRCVASSRDGTQVAHRQDFGEGSEPLTLATAGAHALDFARSQVPRQAARPSTTAADAWFVWYWEMHFRA